MKRGRLRCVVAGLTLALAGHAVCQDGGGSANAAPGWKVLADEDMRGVSAKGYPVPQAGPVRGRPLWAGARQGFNEREPLPLTPPLYPLNPLNPLFGLLSADVSFKDVRYGAGGGAPVWQRDGSLTLGLPAWIGEVDVRTIRTMSANGGDASSFGSLRINALDLSRSTISVAPK